MDHFEGSAFAIQVIAKGAFVDSGSSHEVAFVVEATTIRLNHIAMNDWIMSRLHNVRECYVDGPEGDAQWEAHKAEYAERDRVWEARIVESLDIDPDKGSVCITPAVPEVFTVVHIWEVTSPT